MSMPFATTSTVDLVPAQNVRRDGGRLVAHGGPAWMTVRFARTVPAGRWIALAYRSSYLDTLVRPLLRFVTAAGAVERTLPAPLFGRAEWIGRVPEGTTAMQISPTDRPGPFGFVLEHCRPLWRGSVLAEAWSRDRRRTLLAAGNRCIGRAEEARRLLHVALGNMSLDRYHAWRLARYRPFDPDGLDAPRIEDPRLPHIRLVVTTPAARRGDILWLLEAMHRQSHPHWSLVWIDAGQETPEGNAGRLLTLSPDRTIGDLLQGVSRDMLIGTIGVDDDLPLHAMPVLAACAAAQPDASFFYGDEDAVDAHGRHVDPRLKPDWSPAFDAAGHYTGAALFVRKARLAPIAATPLAGLDLSALLAHAGPAGVGHVRRILLTHRQPSPGMAAHSASAGPPVGDEHPRASIIIPSKDRADLLSICIDSLRRTEAGGDIEIIIADNGSVEDATRALYESFRTDRLIRIIDCSGPFNFSRQCNEGARTARAPMLVFLNNDVEAVDSGWLQALLAWTGRRDVGAVGARLLFPSGRLQHAGVVVGLNGLAGHIDRGAARDSAGYLERNRMAHEVSAVTGACLAVDRAKFDAVGGFDAENLPIELSDIDLCLRLAERGWRTILAPQSVLVHHESASRGDSTAQSARYSGERDFFTRRWGDRLRDDPYFHPALSLASVRTALG